MRLIRRIAKRVLLVALSGTAVWARPVVTKVEPPNWWADYSINPVRVMIRGSGFTSATITVPRGLGASRIWVNAPGTYLFADITIAHGLRPGSYPLEIRTSDGRAEAPFEIAAPLSPAGRFQGFSSNDVIYLIMPDRFANGDPSNDDPAISRGLFDRSNPRLYHGGDLQGIIDHLGYLKKLGVTALWLTPVYDNANEPNRKQAVGGQPVADYHGYGAVDYYGIEEHFGTFDVLRTLVDTAHRTGLKVIQDQVANHVGPYHLWVTDPPKPTWFHGTASQHVNETWQIWTLPDPHASQDLRQTVLNGWFGDVLPDMNQDDPEVARYEIQNALWWVGTAGFDGIRQDTLPYVPRSFWREWSLALKRQYPDLRVVGEVFDGDTAIPSFFQGGVKRFDGIDSGVDTVFDFPMYYAIRDVFARGNSIESLAKTLAKDNLYPNASSLVTFLGLHDVARFMNEPGANVEKLKLAFTFLLTTRGTPMIYYGDEIGMPGGDDPDNRRDFPGGWKEDPRNAFESSGRTADEAAVFDHVRNLTALRMRLEPLRRGKMIDLVLAGQTFAYAREIPTEVVIVAINNGSTAEEIPIHFSGTAEFRNQLGVTRDLKLRNGHGVIRLPGLSAEIYAASR
ncbi:MAG: cyclomaltodextrinase N-terminal domain-containing protein [Acidobacteriaceae bacterium]|nr:cyclomaltodextrinase N-terminal domain-containing protein [Acidobacteriaceae bacterium]MBV9779373.1 cyclomaltodextrinase N-terminal domain-containing protein [Acidobacteriaceae bacterium]